MGAHPLSLQAEDPGVGTLDLVLQQIHLQLLGHLLLVCKAGKRL